MLQEFIIRLVEEYFLTDGSTSTAIHEWTHSSLPDAQEKVIKKYQDNFGDTVYDNKTIVPDEYLDNPQRNLC